MRVSERMLAIIREAETEARAMGLLKGKEKTPRAPRSTRKHGATAPAWMRWMLMLETLLLAAFLWGYFTDDSALVPLRVEAELNAAASVIPTDGRPQPVFHAHGEDFYPAYIQFGAKQRR